VKKGERVASPDLKYQDTTLPLIAERGLTVGARRGQRVETSVSAPVEVEGPIRRGERFGAVTVTVDGRDAGKVPLVAAHAADEATFLEQARSRLPDPVALIAIGAAVILIGFLLVRRASRRRQRSSEERMRSYEERMQRREQQRVPDSEGEST
jgi:Penicillin-binding protein 5, C-terminal domain